jgi:hypothetical protein
MVKYLSFHNSSFALKYIFNVNGKAIVWHTPCCYYWVVQTSILIGQMSFQSLKWKSSIPFFLMGNRKKKHMYQAY